MSELTTMKVVWPNDRGWALINEADFDETVHQIWSDRNTPAGDLRIRIREAVAALDPGDDGLWVGRGRRRGKPILAVLKSVTGRADLTAATVDAAIGEATRESLAATFNKADRGE